MAIEYVKGDLLESPLDVIAHGCNCCGVMGSGVAKAVKEKYPWAFEAYAHHYKNSVVFNASQPIPGTVVPAFNGHMHVLNLLTQRTYGRDPDTRYVSYDAIDKCFTFVAQYMRNFNQYEIGIPKIGAGLGNGYWPAIEAIIALRMEGLHVQVYTPE
jgi:O-acetyl-ADP-ribose deacetylase (regulator of RNase III)